MNEALHAHARYGPRQPLATSRRLEEGRWLGWVPARLLGGAGERGMGLVASKTSRASLLECSLSRDPELECEPMFAWETTPTGQGGAPPVGQVNGGGMLAFTFEARGQRQRAVHSHEPGFDNAMDEGKALNVMRAGGREAREGSERREGTGEQEESGLSRVWRRTRQ